MWLRLACVSLVSWLLFAGMGKAQPVDTTQSSATPARYDDLIRQAVVEFDNSHWVEARALFKRAHELNRSARTWRGLGVTAFELRRYVDAIAELEASLSEPNKPLTAKQHEEVEGLLRRAREFVAVLTLKRKPGNLVLSLSGLPARLSGDQLWIDPGEHKLVATAPGYEQRTIELRVEPGQRGELVIELARPVMADEAPIALSRTEQPTAAPTPRARRPFTWTFAAGAVVALTSATALRVVAGNESEEYGRCTDDSECDDILKRGRRHERASKALWGVGAGLGAAAVVSFFLEGKPRSELRARSDGRSLRLEYTQRF